jgi:4-hydroxy-tetrahydrodipicolinate synthase
MSFRGTYTAIITPFRNGSIDVPSFRKHIEHQIAGGVTGIVPVGTTGESPTVDAEEHIEIIRLAVEFAAGRCEVIAGTGANATAEAIELTQAAEKIGATGTLQVCPYYNKPSQEGLYQHFKTIAANTNLPVMLYSVPGRSVIEISVQTTARLAADCKNITAIKEAGGSVDRVSQLVEATPAGFSILSGDDPLTLPFMVCGAVGLVSVASNIIPDVMSRIVNLCLAQDFAAAAEIHKQYYPLLRGIMSMDVNPVPIKTAAHFLGHCDLELRLPLVAMDDEKNHALKQLLTQFKLPLVQA